MKLVVTEKNDAAQKIADLLGVKKPKADKVYSTPVYRFDVDGEEWVTIGLRGHILEPDFAPTMVYKKRGGWQGITEEGETLPAELPASLPKPPFKKKKPFTEDGVELKSWKMDASKCRRPSSSWASSWAWRFCRARSGKRARGGSAERGSRYAAAARDGSA